MNKSDLIGGAGITAFGLLLIFVIIPTETAEGMYYGLPPTFFPTVMAAGLTASAAALFVQALRRRARGVDSGPAPISRWNLMMFLLAAAVAVAGVMAIGRFGIVYAGPLLIAGFMVFMGERGILRILLTATLPVGAVYMLAMHVLGAPLP